MNLISRRKNIHIDNNDKEEEEDEEEYEEDEDEEEEEMNANFEEDEENFDDVTDDEEDEDNEEEEQMDDEEEEEDEPDFMDNSGKCWEFGCKIGDEKHLKEWCQNKMGGMIVGKEEKLTRQFHCPNKECQFKAIFLKSCSIIYTRNKHNHGVGNAGNMRLKEEGKTHEQDYVDHWGKLWSFHAHIGKNISQDKLLKKFGFTHITKNQKTLNLHCRKINPDGGECQFAGIYLKSNGCLYTRAQHEHTKRGKTPQNIGDNYVDIFGKIWKFKKEIGKNISHKQLSNIFGFGQIQTNVKGLNLHCVKKRPNGKCKFGGVYLKSNGCLYTRGKHNHAHMEKNPKPNVGDDYIDHFGKIWKFNKKIGKNIQQEIFLTKFGFTRIQTKEKGLYLRCEIQRRNKNCKFAGVYLYSNGCLYTKGKHNHEQIEKNPNPNIGDDYVDSQGKSWPFHLQIGKHIPKEIWYSKFGFSNIRKGQKTINLHCGKINRDGGKCTFSGIYLYSNGYLYIRGKHTHKYD